MDAEMLTCAHFIRRQEDTGASAPSRGQTVRTSGLISFYLAPPQRGRGIGIPGSSILAASNYISLARVDHMANKIKVLKVTKQERIGKGI